MATGFNFIEAYRAANPAAPHALVAAREQAFKLIRPNVKLMDRVHDLCRLAFHMPFDDARYADWFDKHISDTDPRFVLSQDVADAGRMATMLLRDFVLSGSEPVAMTVLATSFAGRRLAFDNGELVTQARDLIAARAKQPRTRASSAALSVSNAKELEPILLSLEAGVTPAATKLALENVQKGAADAVTAINDAYQSLRNDNIRLAEEVDMLWFYLGETSNILDIPLNALPAASLPFVAGIDLGAMVQSIPGPYGVYGIIKRTLGAAVAKTVTLEDGLDVLSQQQISSLACEKAPEIFSLHTALRLAARGGSWKEAFHAACPDLVNVKISHTDAAVQAYRERTSLVHAGLDK
ncbi:MAG: hypothetical protein K2X57_06700 [Xanthobacteraceae bacterium]|nr:hypothetical protein [Xanthobacteraceae bacterium]